MDLTLQLQKHYPQGNPCKDCKTAKAWSMLKMINNKYPCCYSSNTCTWSRTQTMTSNVNKGECDGKCWEEIYNWDTYQSPCNGDRGASLVIKENNRWSATLIQCYTNFSERTSQTNFAKYILDSWQLEFSVHVFCPRMTAAWILLYMQKLILK